MRLSKNFSKPLVFLLVNFFPFTIMKKLFAISTLFVLTACQHVASDASDAEKNMAEMMGITVEELRNQTPEEHMKMMMEMDQ